MPQAPRTYWHLGNARRVPSEYEIGTSRLLYYLERGGFAVELPTSAWYRRHQVGSPLGHVGWEAFEDPRATTYASYVRRQRDRESFVSTLLQPVEEAGYDASLAGDWLVTLERTLPTLRYVCHGLQMIAAYVGQIAPSGRLAVVSLFQAGDEMRRTQGLAYRMALARLHRPSFGNDSRERWQSDPSWQPLRRTIEELMATYDWGEALVALNVCVKPMIDRLFMVELASLAERSGDYLDGQLLRSFAEDCAWQRAWTERFMAMVAGREEPAQAAVRGWIATWRPAAEEAVTAAAANLGAEGRARVSRAAEASHSLAGPFAEEMAEARRAP